MSIVNYLDNLLGDGTPKSTTRGQQYSYKCPICQDYKERLFVHPSKGVCHCHNCGYSVSIVTLISDVNSTSWRDALKTFRQYAGYNFEMPDNIESEILSKLVALDKTEVDTFKIVHPLPDEFILMEEAKTPEGIRAKDYLKKRGVYKKSWEKYFIGYCESGKYEGRIILPDFEDGELVYWQARTYHPEPTIPLLRKEFRKVLNPVLDKEDIEAGYKSVDKSSVVSHIDFVKASGTAIVCEGRFDALTLGDYGAGIHGKVLSDEQFIKLVKLKPYLDTIIVMLDGDAYGYALKIAKRLSGHFPEVLVARLDLPDDPNGIGLAGCLEAIEKAVPYSPSLEIRAKLYGWA